MLRSCEKQARAVWVQDVEGGNDLISPYRLHRKAFIELIRSCEYPPVTVGARLDGRRGREAKIGLRPSHVSRASTAAAASAGRDK